MLILSWNVAGLSTTVNRIHENYNCVSRRPPPAADREGSTVDSPSNKRQKPNHPSVSGKRMHSSAATTTACCSALANFFHLHHADIVCFQEHKIPKHQLSNRTEPKHLSRVPGYESFWSCCVDASARGMNGVCTYARVGSVVRADPCPFRNQQLDRQGRCVMTDHGDFCLFNVYVPATGGQSLRSKLHFLDALRKSMQEARKQKPVILVGDLNITHRPLDVHWSDRVVYVDSILQEVRNATVWSSSAGESRPTVVPQWKRDVAQHWDRIRLALTTLRAVPTTTRNTKTSQQYEKFRASVTVSSESCTAVSNPLTSNGSSNTVNKDPSDTSPVSATSATSSRQVFLGKHEASESWCLMDYECILNSTKLRTDDDDDDDDDDDRGASDGYGVGNDAVRDEELGSVVIIRPPNVVSVSVLAELMGKIAGVLWTEEMQRDISDKHGAVVAEMPTRHWLSSVIDEDGMVDAFRHLYPGARDRFTCWHQFTNRRYYNEGSRIDYTLVDRSLLDRVRPGPVQGLRCCELPPAERSAVDQQRHHPQHCEAYHLTEEAALAAATANGRFQPVSFEGGGIQEASREALDSQFGAPHTGMVYTPPSFSDHIAVSLLLDGDGMFRTDLKLDTNDSLTKKSQPHKLQTSIASFFGSASVASGGSNKPQDPVNAAGAAGDARPPGASVLLSKKSRYHFAPAGVKEAKATEPSKLSRAPSSNKKKPARAKPPTNSILNHFKRSSHE